jgi:hypothetical protein
MDLWNLCEYHQAVHVTNCIIMELMTKLLPDIGNFLLRIK